MASILELKRTNQYSNWLRNFKVFLNGIEYEKSLTMKPSAMSWSRGSTNNILRSIGAGAIVIRLPYRRMRLFN
ncbi:hypothetical protein [Paenibacillus sp. BK720]|uniref:hypothetical protein n=1 Tax=Paenibacillus sp. BK720 TaxID=2587092 RepID=UPI001ABA39A1|nr:hypothetical protein [Paenibacillus sp. BK720]NIK67807.1 hypothetical protein [Paenibacillus sp. BK720]